MDQSTVSPPSREKLLRQAALLAWITIIYNVAEGLVSVVLGVDDETLALFGFGLDSFVEVISGIGIWHMIRRMRLTPLEAPDRFEQRALKITGSAFYLLTAGLVLTAIVNSVQGHHPRTTVWGIVVASVSIATMGALIHLKTKVGRALGSEAILSDANCTRACLYLSFVLLGASVGYELTGIGYLDAAGALWIAWYAWKEAREAFDKARGKSCSCGCTANTQGPFRNPPCAPIPPPPPE